MTRLYYERGPVKIYHGDCLEWLPALESGIVDIACSSPPYNMIPKTSASGIYAEHSRKLNGGYESHADNMPQDQYEAWQREAFGECLRVCKGLVWINHKVKFIDRKGRHPLRFYPWELFADVIWDRGGSLTLNANRYAPSHEYILAFGAPHYWDRCNDTDLTVWRIRPETSVDGHPCPFPVEIPLRCILSSCPPDGTVCDPFGGSFTTAIACIRTGRKFIGCELEERYCEIGAKRCDRELDQGRLPFAPPEPAPVQKEMFE